MQNASDILHFIFDDAQLGAILCIYNDHRDNRRHMIYMNYLSFDIGKVILRAKDVSTTPYYQPVLVESLLHWDTRTE